MEQPAPSYCLLGSRSLMLRVSSSPSEAASASRPTGAKLPVRAEISCHALLSSKQAPVPLSHVARVTGILEHRDAASVIDPLPTKTG